MRSVFRERNRPVAGSDSTDASPGTMTGSRRAVTTLVDQGFASVSNFALGVAIARTAGVAGLGGFAFAYAGWQVLAAMHRSLITDPMAIEGDLRIARNAQRIQRG